MPYADSQKQRAYMRDWRKRHRDAHQTHQQTEQEAMLRLVGQLRTRLHGPRHDIVSMARTLQTVLEVLERLVAAHKP